MSRTESSHWMPAAARTPLWLPGLLMLVGCGTPVSLGADCPLGDPVCGTGRQRPDARVDLFDASHALSDSAVQQPDAQVDASDAAFVAPHDAGPHDAGPHDAGPHDAGLTGCHLLTAASDCTLPEGKYTTSLVGGRSYTLVLKSSAAFAAGDVFDVVSGQPACGFGEVLGTVAATTSLASVSICVRPQTSTDAVYVSSESLVPSAFDLTQCDGC